MGSDVERDYTAFYRGTKMIWMEEILTSKIGGVL